MISRLLCIMLQTISEDFAKVEGYLSHLSKISKEVSINLYLCKTIVCLFVCFFKVARRPIIGALCI